MHACHLAILQHTHIELILSFSQSFIMHRNDQRGSQRIKLNYKDCNRLKFRGLKDMESDISSIEKRFAYGFLQKLLKWMEIAQEFIAHLGTVSFGLTL